MVTDKKYAQKETKKGCCLFKHLFILRNAQLQGPQEQEEQENFAKPVVDIAASSRSLTWQPSWG